VIDIQVTIVVRTSAPRQAGTARLRIHVTVPGHALHEDSFSDGDTLAQAAVIARTHRNTQPPLLQPEEARLWLYSRLLRRNLYRRLQRKFAWSMPDGPSPRAEAYVACTMRASHRDNAVQTHVKKQASGLRYEGRRSPGPYGRIALVKLIQGGSDFRGDGHNRRCRPPHPAAIALRFAVQAV
jgi:hypothetical protein